MYEQIRDLKAGKSVMKPIYNHVNGTLDTPEEIKATPIVIIEGLHPFVDERVRDLLDFTIYLDISDEIKFAWKIQRDMMERGHSLESIKASIEVRRGHAFFPDVTQTRWASVVDETRTALEPTAPLPSILVVVGTLHSCPLFECADGESGKVDFISPAVRLPLTYLARNKQVQKLRQSSRTI